MKGSRAKKAAGGDEVVTKTPAPPEKPRDGNAAPRPHPAVPAELVVVQIPAEEFQCIIAQLRTNELLGAAAAETLEAAAGLGPPVSPASKPAKELRNKVAECREEAEVPEKGAKRRVSVNEAQADEAHDAETHNADVEKDAPDPPEPPELPELNLTPKQNHMRTDLEMWAMDEVPAIYGVDDSEELDESLQEDGQAAKITQLIAETNQDAQKKLLDDWLKGAPEDAKNEFIAEIIEKVGKIQALGPKKKKKKKKDT